MTLVSHPLRERVVSEMHLRRMPPMHARMCVVQTVRIVDAEEREAERAHVARMPGVPPAEVHIRPRHADGRTADGQEFLWERHSEASTATVIAPARTDDPFALCVGGEAALGWLEFAPGGAIRATRIGFVANEDVAAGIVGSSGFDTSDLVSCRIGASRIWSDFRVHADGYGRLLIAVGDTDAADLGRLVQRVQELGNYRNLALLGLPLAQQHGETLGELETRLVAISERLTGGGDDGSALLDRLCTLSAEAAVITAATAFRLSATAAYARIVSDRLGAIQCQPVPGFQTLGEFTDRRLLPAVRTCASFQARLEDLSRRIDRTTALLRTRVDLAMQAQNVDLLRSMEASAARQLRLQHLVEGLSVVAVSYYALGLLTHLFPMVAAFSGLAEETISAIALVPVVAAVALVLRWRTRSLHDR